MTSEINRRTEYANQEYDGYAIPPYDPTIPSEERKRLREEAKKKLMKTIERITSSKV